MRYSEFVAGGWDACQDGMAGGEKENGRVIQCYVAPFVHRLVSNFQWHSGLSEHNSVTSIEISPPRQAAKVFLRLREQTNQCKSCGALQKPSAPNLTENLAMLP